ncbi:MAG: tRNA nucleotidyltransferase [Clostridia bacterium]|nr:tRNA nucleotidyltransferase [Clostridia bacterium]
MDHIPQTLMEAISVLERGGEQGWLVGGCVRDSLMGKIPHDWDVTTSASPTKMLELFSGYKLIETGLKHGTVTVVISGEQIEITTFRIDGEYHDNRRPSSVEFTENIALDLSRRDFTVNAMAYSPERGLCDLFGGREDLDAGLIRCVGEPDKRFGEDGLRILRALRFASVLDFEIHADTAESVHRNRELLKNISAERIFSEFTKLLCGKGVGRILREYPDVIGVFVPEVLPCVGFDQRTPWHDRDVWEHTIGAVEAVDPEPLMRLAMFFHDLGKPGCMTVDGPVCHYRGHPEASAEIAVRVLERLKSDRSTERTVKTIVAGHETVVKMPADRVTVKTVLRRFGPENTKRLIASARADLAAKPKLVGQKEKIDAVEALVFDVLEKNECFDLKGLAVDGRMLIAAGVPKGKILGDVLDRLLDGVISGELENSAGVLTEAAKTAALESGEV